MHILLFIFYTVLLSWLLLKCPFFKDIRPGLLVGFFALRTAMGCLHNWIAYKYYPQHGDIWRFFQDSFVTRHELAAGFKVFWADNSSLSYLPHNLIEWMHVVFNFLSFDNFYINTLFFSFLTLGGHIALFRTVFEQFSKDALSAICMLLLPSILFWTSCIHTEGIIYSMLGWLFYTLHRSFKESWTTTRILRALLLTILVIFFRPAIGCALIPALTIWTAGAGNIRPHRSIWIIAALLFIGLLIWRPGLIDSIPRSLAARQDEFLQLKGNSRIHVAPLEPSWKSLWNNLGDALSNGMFQPQPGVGGQRIYLAFSLELMAIWLIVGCSLLAFFASGLMGRYTPLPHYPRYFATAFLLLAFLGILLIGWVIPFIGAIVRYRSIYLPFLLPPYLATLHRYGKYWGINNRLICRIFK